MWRATVIERVQDGQVVVSIPALFRGDPVGPMQSAVDAQVGDAVIVADLVPEAKVRDWWVVGYESQIGRWGSPYPHKHPIGQVTGLVEALEGKADVGTGGTGSSDWADITGKPDTYPPSTHTHAQEDVTGLTDLAADVNDATYLATPNTIPRRAANGGFRVVTGGNVQDAVNVEHVSTNYVSKDSYNAGMAAKANKPGDWVPITSSYWVTDISGARPLSVRSTPVGTQISGRIRFTSTVSMDTVVAAMPAGYLPDFAQMMNVAAMGPGPSYTALRYQFGINAAGNISARESMAAGARLNFNETLIY